MADSFVIETAALQKHYDGVEALRGLDLQVPAGRSGYRPNRRET